MRTAWRKRTISSNAAKPFVSSVAYPDWNPFITRASGDWAVGNTVAVTAGGMDFKPKVLAFTPNRELRWKGKLLFNGLFDGEHYFLLTDNGDGTTGLEHGEYFSGLAYKVAYADEAKEDIHQILHYLNTT